jgi:hypothetical protein
MALAKFISPILGYNQSVNFPFYNHVTNSGLHIDWLIHSYNHITHSGLNAFGELLFR